MIRLYPDSISAIAFVVVVVSGLAAYCFLLWAERDHTPGPMHPAYRRCRVNGCTDSAVTTVARRAYVDGEDLSLVPVLPMCGRCAQELIADGWKEIR